MNYLDLFHGIGGFAVGAYWAGMKFENHYGSDIESYLVELYKKRFPDSIQLGDIREIDCEKLMADTDKRRKKSSVQTRGNESEKSSRTDWIITGGFPCQDISVAGKGTGIRGSRSGLWFEMWRIIRDLRPRFAIMENVGALTFRGLTDVLGSLAEIGYDAEWQDIRAEDVGAPHRRERIWIIAYPCSKRLEVRKRESSRKTKSSSTERSCEEMAYPSIERKRGLYIRSRKSRQTEIIIDGNGKEISDTSCKLQYRARESRSAGRDESTDGSGKISNTNGSRKSLCGNISGMGRFGKSDEGNARSYWQSEPNVGRLADGVSGRVDRLKGLGNAIVPQIAELLFRQIKEQI